MFYNGLYKKRCDNWIMRKQFKYLGFYSMGKTTQTSKSNGLYTVLPNVKKGVADAGSKIYNNLQLEDLPNEVWVDVYGYDGIYEVSNLGRVKSLERYVSNGRGGKMSVKERILNPQSNDEDDLMQDFVSIITSFVARLYGRRRSKRLTEKIIKEAVK